MSSRLQPEVGSVSAAFWSELGEAPRDADAVTAGIHAAITDARSVIPDVFMEEATFARYLARAVKRAAIAPEDWATLAISDLYLACACVAGEPNAVATLKTRHSASIRAAIGKLVPAADVDENEQRLLETMVVGDAASPPRLASYAGKAPLDRWLVVSAQRVALMGLRKVRSEREAHHAAAAEPAASAASDPEMALLKEKYRGEFERALAEALGRLPERDRLLLRLQLVNGVTLDKIGKMLGVSQPTASRLMAGVRAALLGDIKQILRERMKLSSGDLLSIGRAVASQLDLSLSVLLASK